MEGISYNFIETLQTHCPLQEYSTMNKRYNDRQYIILSTTFQIARNPGKLSMSKHCVPVLFSTPPMYAHAWEHLNAKTCI